MSKGVTYMKVAELFVKCLEHEGVEYIFGVPGEENIDLMDALKESSIEFIVTRHETGAAFMASHYGRLTGKPGVCLATLGPGATNLLTGVANANMDQCPVVAITGQAGLNRQHKISHQYYDMVSVYEPVTKWNAQVKKAEIVPEVIRKAFQVAGEEKPGATHIDLPEDVASQEVESTPLEIRSEPISIASDHMVKDATELISHAKTPIILAGNGITRDHAAENLRQFVEKQQIPVVHSFMGKGALSWEHELSLLTAGVTNDYPSCAFEKADLIIPIGFDMAEVAPKSWNPKGATPILHIDSQPAETDEYYPVETSLIGDISSNIDKLNEELEPQERDLSWVASIREKALGELKQFEQDTSFPMKPQKILSDLRAVLKPEDIVISDVGAHKMWTSRLFHTYETNTCLISNGLASMGVAVPGAIGAKLVEPNKTVVALCGDGALQMTIAEMETAKRLNLPIIVLLWRDEGYGLIEWHQMRHFGRASHIDFGNPDYIQLAEAYGFEGMQIQSGDTLKETLQKAVSLNKPVLIDCPVDYDENMKLTEKLKNIQCE